MAESWRGSSAVVCDPVPVARDHLAALLADLGIQVWPADTVGGALTLLAAKKPPLLLTELLFSDIEGKRVLTTFRERCPGLIIVVCSALSSRAAVAAAREAGVHDFLAKPVRPDRLRQALASAARRLAGAGAETA